MLQEGEMAWGPYQKGPIPVDFIGGLVFQAKRRVPQAEKFITDPTRYKGKKNRSWVREEEEDFFFFSGRSDWVSRRTNDLQNPVESRGVAIMLVMKIPMAKMISSRLDMKKS